MSPNPPPETTEPKPNKTKPARTDRPRSDERLAFDGVIYRLRTG